MKKILFAIAAVAMLFATSCKKDNNAPEDITLGENEFLATIDNGANPQNAPRISDGMSTMTTIDANRYVIWEQGDEITINNILYTTNTSGNSVVFSTDGTKATGSNFHAFYPASIAGTGANGTLPTTQIYEEANAVRHLPMYAYSTSHQLTFHNICAVLKIVIPSYVNGADSIVVSSEKGLNGAFSVDASYNAVMTNVTPTDAEKTITIKKSSGTFATNETVYIAVPAANYTALNIQFFVGAASVWNKSISHNLEVNKIYPINMTEDYVCFTALAAPSTLKFSKAGLLDFIATGGTWQTYNTADSVITLNNVGDKVYFKAHQDNNTLNNGRFSSVGNNQYQDDGSRFKVSGNIMYLLKADGSLTDFGTNTYVFNGLFNVMLSLEDASQLSLPAMTMTEGCYSYMFGSCRNLAKAPLLPATTMAEKCYISMFNATALTTAPALPATTMESECYNGMFSSCQSLTTAPTLPATTLANRCYCDMFYNCTNLTTAPALPVTTLATYCYSGMFDGCSSLTTAPTLPATTLANYCYYRMFQDCTNLTTAPVLEAATLVTSCYYEMFRGCYALTSVTMKATNVPTADCLNDWLTQTSSGTLTIHSSLSSSSGAGATITSKTPDSWSITNGTSSWSGTYE